ncbi:MAG: sugar phosphate isomerase/epimerase [bacterium]|nr:sugar phosphate isomerase/epimerase [bacterium]
MTTAHLVCLTLPYARFPLERGLEGVARAGYQYVGLGWPHQGEDPLGLDPEGSLVGQAQELCTQYHLTPVVIGRGPISVSNRAEDLKRRIDVAKALGAKTIQTAGAGGYKRFPDEPLDPDTFRKAHEAFVKDLQVAGSYAQEQGIVLALKPHTGNTATAAHLARLLPEIDRPSVKACYDPGNVHFYEGISPEDDFPAIADQTDEIVAKDHTGPRAERHFPIPGEGDIDWTRIFTTAQNTGFQGAVVIERVDGTGGQISPEELDDRIVRARNNLMTLLENAGFQIE